MIRYRQVGKITNEHKDDVKDILLQFMSDNDATVITDQIFKILGLEEEEDK